MNNSISNKGQTLLKAANPSFSSACSSFALLFQKEGQFPDFFGSVVADAGDVNADGRADVLVSTYHTDFNPNGHDNNGSVFIFSGRDSSLLYRKDGNPGDRLGWSAAGAGDVNNDGYADFIACALTANGDAGSVFVYSGRDGSVLYHIDGAYSWDNLNSVSGAGDVNADGWDDFIIGNTTEIGGPLYGKANVYSGRDGSILYHLDGSLYVDTGGIFGYSVNGAGDVNADGFSDFVIGAPGGYFSTMGIGRAFVFSGKNGSVLFQKNGGLPCPPDYPPNSFGMAVAGAGDVNKDGFADVLVGAPFFECPYNPGAVFVYSGKDGSLLFQKIGKPGVYDSGRFGLSVDGSGDVNGDEFDDFIVSSPGSEGALVYSGSDGELMVQKGGQRVAGGGKINADSRSDFIIGSSGAGGGAGAVYILGLVIAEKGDLNGDSALSAADVMLTLNCVFLGSGNCDACFADINCDAFLTPSDVVLELGKVFAERPFPCGL